MCDKCYISLQVHKQGSQLIESEVIHHNGTMEQLQNAVFTFVRPQPGLLGVASRRLGMRAVIVLQVDRRDGLCL